MRPTLDERLDERTYYDPNTGCWLWLGSRDTNGYGSIGVGGRQRSTHAVTYEREVGPIPPGLDLDHLCNQRACRSPYHLEAVTHQENAKRVWVRLRAAGLGRPWRLVSDP